MFRELMLELIEFGQLSPGDAVSVAEQIKAASGGRIKDETMAEFRSRAEQASGNVRTGPS